MSSKDLASDAKWLCYAFIVLQGADLKLNPTKATLVCLVCLSVLGHLMSEEDIQQDLSLLWWFPTSLFPLTPRNCRISLVWLGITTSSWRDSHSPLLHFMRFCRRKLCANELTLAKLHFATEKSTDFLPITAFPDFAVPYIQLYTSASTVGLEPIMDKTQKW